MRQSLLLPLMLWPVLTGSAQEPGTVDVRLFGAEGQDEATAVWADGHGILLAGETTSDILMAEGQAVWAPGGPTGLKGFVTAFDTALNWSWSFAFVGSPDAPLEAPSTLAVRDVVRSPSDSATAWVLYDAPVEGQWQSTLMGVHPEDGILAHHSWSTGGVITSIALVATESGFIWVGNEAPTAVPGGNGGIRLGFWDGQTESSPTLAWLDGAEGHIPVAADWHADTLYIAAHGPDPVAPSAILMVAVISGNPTLVGTAPIADPDLSIVGLTAGPQGVAWSGTLQSPDGTLDAVYGRLNASADPADPSLWGQSWVQETVSGSDRPARTLQWMGDVVQCAARTTEAGAGGSGILVQTRFGETGAWFGQFAFGGTGEEDLHAMALDHEGRLLLAGSSNSWTELGPDNGSLDAALFRISTPQLQNGFETTAIQAVLPDAAFVGFGAPNTPATNSTPAVTLRHGDRWPFAPESRWAILDAAGRLSASGHGGHWTCTGAEGWRVVLESDGHGHTLRCRLWVAP